MKRALSAALALALSAGITNGQSLPAVEFKGIALGAAHNLSNDSRYRCNIRRGHALGDEFCITTSAARETIAGAHASSVSVMSYDGAVKRIIIVIPTSSFDQVKDALSVKYAAPTSSTVEPWQSRGGVRLSARNITWALPTGTILIVERATRMDEATIVMESQDAESLYLQRKALSAPSNARDM